MNQFTHLTLKLLSPKILKFRLLTDKHKQIHKLMKEKLKLVHKPMLQLNLEQETLKLKQLKNQFQKLELLTNLKLVPKSL